MSTVTSTDGLLSMHDNAVRFDLNRRLSEDRKKSLDPNGVHVLQFSMVHNDDHMRGLWLTKIEGEDTPAHSWVDCSFEAFNEFTSTLKRLGTTPREAEEQCL